MGVVALESFEPALTPSLDHRDSHHSDQEIPSIDLLPFFEPDSSPGIAAGRERIIQEIARACEEWGFFQVVNHGLDCDLITQSLRASKDFFDLSMEEKMKVRPPPGTCPVPMGFCHNSGIDGLVERKEHLFFFAEDGSPTKSPDSFSKYNVWPGKPQNFCSIVRERLIVEGQKTAIFLLSLISRSLGLPDNFLYEHYKEKMNALIMLFYPVSDIPEDIGLHKHQDGNILSVVAQNETEGLQVLKDDKWITVKPRTGSLVVNVGDIVQVWSNDRYKSVQHRVINNDQNVRYSFAFSCVPGVSTLVAPLPQFTSEIQQAPRYREFQYGEYMMYRFENKKIVSKNSEEITIKYYSTAEE
ncbi:2-oxoglutarate-Iron(II)-dependent oxygenase [Selaginella moellendorffii]|uniref:2-oxoglutarate-Iron(II)-dependent oxygenase n=2 Tax=Selaginella moellendorffii TaxID=88036 RepID=D8RC34_SELML|nr:2-oxoglutarate-Iron(II)-dependent oxygenase [Selaginella moellendorffii]